jgi:GAF domain-containing protein
MTERSAGVPLDAVLCTDQLKQRPSRPADHRAESQALSSLARELAQSPRTILQRLVDVALEVCRGHSAGISLLEQGDPGHLSPDGDHFRWYAVAGQWAPLIWNTTTPREHGPCGTVLDRNCTLLFRNAHRHFQQFASVKPLLVEGLLVPFHVDGKAVGTVWVITHDETRKFDSEDQRLLEVLAHFAAAAYQVRRSIVEQARINHELQVERQQRQDAESVPRQTAPRPRRQAGEAET